MSAIEKITAQ
jgi:solute carrier family 8 (sodium/calcium exchanger)